MSGQWKLKYVYENGSSPLLSGPGIGLLTATAMVAATSGDVSHFKDARHFSSWFGLTPKEYSSGNTRYLGRISKKGDRYLLISPLLFRTRPMRNIAPVDRVERGVIAQPVAA